MDLDDLRSVTTVVLFVLFVGIVAWAWSCDNRRRFEQASRLPFEDESEPQVPGGSRRIPASPGP